MSGVAPLVCASCHCLSREARETSAREWARGDARLKYGLPCRISFRILVGGVSFSFMALLRTTDASGRQGQYQLNIKMPCTIGRAPDNQIVLDDPRASRHHAHIKPNDDGAFVIVDGYYVNGQIHRSANKVYV